MDATRARTHVLVVDGNVADLHRLGSFLDGLFAWEVARSLPEAEVKVHRLRPRVVMLSDEWGEGATSDFCRRLKAGPLRRELVVVTLTRADPREVEVAWSRQSGVDLHLHKPVEQQAVLDCLRLSWQVLKKGQVAEAASAGRPAADVQPLETRRGPTPAEVAAKVHEILHMEVSAVGIRRMLGRRDQSQAS